MKQTENIMGTKKGPPSSRFHVHTAYGIHDDPGAL